MRRDDKIKTTLNYTNVSCVIIAVIVVLVNAIAADATIRWPTYEKELQDEVDDLKILNAVQQSMYEYELRHRHHHRQKRAEKSVCYNELGCFEDSGPFGYLDMLPISPEEIGTKFYFYSTENRGEKPLFEIPYLNMSRMFYEIKSNKNKSASLIESSFGENATALTPELIQNIKALKSFKGFDRMSIRVIVHGFGSACHHVWIYDLRAALMAVENCIVICVDWENGATLPNYVRAAANTRLIGKQLALLMKNLQSHKKLDLSRVHIIGFSLGAHVSGFAGSELPGLRRITGLDPAGPLFESQHIKARLDSSDANFVDVIHSNGENLILGGLGAWQPMGDVDFYPNGGRVQTGCSNIFVGAVTDFIWSPSVVEGRSLCNHRRAYKFFIDSIASKCLFPAFPCDTYDDFLKGNCFPCDDSNYKDARCGNMGYYADKSTGRGQLYLITRDEAPFCAHQFHIEIHTSESDLPLRTVGKIEATLHGEQLLNETFSITDKDDAELFAGDVISRILVPHPLLGFPKSISLTYKTYSGWLSKGLSQWNINKIVLTDSFGTSYSMCRNLMHLESGNSVLIELQPGVCELTIENDFTFAPLDRSENVTSTDATNANMLNSDDVDKLREKKNAINLSTNYENISEKKTDEYTENKDGLSMHPVLENGNSLERNSVESSRSLNSQIPAEIYEPILKDRPKLKLHTGRTFDSLGDSQSNVFVEEEIFEPILKAKPNRSRKQKQMQFDATSDRNSSYFNVQLLPLRLSEIFGRAEKYARETLLPLISEQAPRLFGFGEREANLRRPKYIPKIGAIRNETVNRERQINLPPILNDTVVVDNPTDANTNDEIASDDSNIKNSTSTTRDIKRSDQTESQNIVNEARGSKNILSLLRNRDKRTTSIPVLEQPAISDLNGNDEKSLPLIPPKAHPFPYRFEIPVDPLQDRKDKKFMVTK